MDTREGATHSRLHSGGAPELRPPHRLASRPVRGRRWCRPAARLLVRPRRVSCRLTESHENSVKSQQISRQSRANLRQISGKSQANLTKSHATSFFSRKVSALSLHLKQTATISITTRSRAGLSSLVVHVLQLYSSTQQHRHSKTHALTFSTDRHRQTESDRASLTGVYPLW